MTIPPFDHETTACRIAQEQWGQMPLRRRLALVRQFRHLLADHADELTAAVEHDVDRPPAEVLGSDILPLAAACRFVEKSAAAWLKARRVRGTPLFLFGQKDWVHRRPLGIVGIIGTWNYPILLNGVQLIQALAAGNGVLWKPSEHATTSSGVLHRLSLQAGIPANLFQLLPATRDAGARLVESKIDHLIFTGSAAVGRKIAIRCAERLIPSTLELSGIDAMFVLADADIELAAKAAWFGVTLNRGQTCLAVRRIFVQRKVLDPFQLALRQRIESGRPMRLVMAGQVEQVQRLLTDARARGSDIWAASKADTAQTDSRTMMPQIITNATSEFAVCQEECFGPIAAMLPFDEIDDAIRMDKQCSFALGASIFTTDMNRADLLAARLRTGHVSINDVIAPTAHPATPFGGTGQSGWGVTQGAEGLLAMTRPQIVSTRGGTFRPHFDGISSALDTALRGMLSWSHGARFRQRWLGLWNMMSGFRRIGNDTKQKNAGV